MFTQTVEYALRIAVCLAASHPKPQTADDLARLTRVPRAYLAKVIQAMVRGGTARSKRGVGGGVALANAPEELTLLDVINSVDPIKRLEGIPADDEGRGKELGGLHQCCEKALVSVEQVFGELTLAEVVKNGHAAAPAAPTNNQGPSGMDRNSTSNGHAPSPTQIPHEGPTRSFVTPMTMAHGSVGLGGSNGHSVSEHPAASGMV